LGTQGRIDVAADEEVEPVGFTHQGTDVLQA
jgi:hypothetical protein